MNTLGQNIRAARIIAGLTQEELALEVFVSPGAISHYENDRYRASPSTLQLISQVVGVSVEDLMSGDGSRWTGRERVKRKEIDFPEIDEDGELLLKRIWLLITEWNKNKNKGL